jgi:hypothetical protein
MNFLFRPHQANTETNNMVMMQIIFKLIMITDELSYLNIWNEVVHVYKLCMGHLFMC